MDRTTDKTLPPGHARHSPERPREHRGRSRIGNLIDRVGNAGLGALIRNQLVQMKGRVSRPGDPLEQEADRIAGTVASGSPPAIQRACTCGTGVACEACQNEGALVQRRPSGGAGRSAAPSDGSLVTTSGRPLDAATREHFEGWFGRDFTDVRVHTGSDAAASADALAADAFTVGSDMAFAPGRYAPDTPQGQRLLAHELTHVVQQTDAASAGPAAEKQAAPPVGAITHGSADRVMRQTNFVSTMEICHRLLKSRTFHVSRGGIVVTANARWEASDEWQGSEAPACGNPVYRMSLSDVGWLFDDEYGTCEFPMGAPASRAWGHLPGGDYYLTIWTNNTNPNCCLRGDIMVAEEAGLPEGCTQPPPGPLEILHTALDVAGLIPVLGVIPDAVNSGIYVVEGDWTNAGISAIAMIPAFGDAASIVRTGTRAALRIEGRAVTRLGADAIATGLRDARATRPALHAAEDTVETVLDRERREFLEMLSEEGSSGVRAGEPITMHPHGGAREAREMLDVTGEFQSAHGLPQSIGRSIPGYNPLDALATIHQRAAHSGMDQYWKEAFQQMRREGRTSATAQEIYDAVAESYRRSPDLAPGMAETFALRLQDEMFVEYGLRAADEIPLPYPNIRPSR
jgi:hypothetical protein